MDERGKETKRLSLAGWIAVMILGGVLSLIGLVSVVTGVASDLYEEVWSFLLGVEGARQEAPYKIEMEGLRVERGREYSLWLKTGGRAIENRDLSVSVNVVDAGGNALGEMPENFSFGYVRNSGGGWQYYKIGEFVAKSDGPVSIRVTVRGSWNVPQEAKLVVRVPGRVAVPWRDAWLLLGGALLVSFSVWMMASKRAT